MDKSAPWSALVAIAFDVLRKPSKIQSAGLSIPTHVAPCQCCEEWLNRCRVAQSALPSNSPQEASVAHLLGACVERFFGFVPAFSNWSVASERYLESECEVEGSAKGGRVASVRGPPKFSLEAHSPQESRRVRVRRAMPPVLGLCAGQTFGGEAMHGTRQMQLWPVP